MRKTLIVCLCSLVLAFTACKKDTIETTLTTSSDYMPLKVGNYWVYQTYQLSLATNTYVPWNSMRDSICIDSDTTINNATYYKRVAYQNSVVTKVDYVRYHNDQLVDDKGEVHFSALSTTTDIDSVDLTNGAYFIMDYSLGTATPTIQVNAGSFVCLDWMAQCRIQEPNAATTKPLVHDYYARGIGMVQRQCYSLFGEIPARINLETYHLN